MYDWKSDAFLLKSYKSSSSVNDDGDEAVWPKLLDEGSNRHLPVLQLRSQSLHRQFRQLQCDLRFKPLFFQ